MRLRKNRVKREIYINTGLPQEIREISKKKSNFIPKGTG